MNILVFGAGSLGSLLGAILSDEHEVTLVARKDHTNAINASGLRVSGLLEKTTHPLGLTKVEEVPWPPDLVLLTVKSYDTIQACKLLRLALPPTPVVSFQNGLGNREKMRTLLWAEEFVYGATISAGAMLAGPGHVVYTGEGVVRMESGKRGHEAVFGALADGLRGSDVVVEIVEDIALAIWEKAAVNMGINYPTALSRKENGVLAERWPHMKEFVSGLMGEVCAVANAEGVPLDPTICEERVLEVATKTARNRSSMLQDVERGRRTENDSLAGELLRRGEKHGLNLPRARSLHSLMRLVEESTGASDK